METFLGMRETRIETGQGPREAKSKNGLKVVKATDFEANPEEIGVLEKHQVVLNEESVETVGI
jgi:hypothetical protein